jgi:ABC-2 type transport system ATP-binding protein
VCGEEAAIDRDNRRISAPVRDRVAALTGVARSLDDAGIVVEDIALRRPTLDEVFMHLTGHRAVAAREEVAA